MAKTILIVDDSSSIRQMVRFTLERTGYTVIEAVDGVDGLKKAKAHKCDLIFTDQNMPNKTGLELLKDLRSDTSYKLTPILLLTTESSGEIKTLGKNLGATGWLTKPFDPAKLIEIVKKVIG